MARMNEIVDLYWTEAGDFTLGTNGDLEDTKNIHYRGLLQRVLTRIRSRKGDWALQSSVGAGLTGYIGKANNAATGGNIKNAIVTELMQDDLLRGHEFVVDIFPISKYVVAGAVVITPPRSGGQIVLTLTYDMRDNRMIPRNI